LAWSQDGKTLVSGGADTTVLVWEIAALMRQARQPVNPTPQELEVLWSDLAGDDACKAYAAIGRLIACPQPAVPFLGKQLQPPADPGRIDRLIADLDDNRFQVRENATRELEQLGPLAESALEQALAGQPSVEVRRRVERLLAALQERGLTPHQLRVGRAIEVLEHIGTPEAQEVLRALARGAFEQEAPGRKPTIDELVVRAWVRGVAVPRQTREARAALMRLAQRATLP
jgi:hypothetical protein